MHGNNPQCPTCGTPMSPDGRGSSGAGAYSRGDTFNVAQDLEYFRCDKHGQFTKTPDGTLWPGPDQEPPKPKAAE